MKALKLVVASVAMLVSVTAFSQTDTTKRDTTTRKDTTRKDSLVRVQQAESASTVQQAQPSTAQKQQFPAPNSGRNYIPVLGSFQSAQTDAENKSITITADETNAGKIWIEGLTPVKFYALLKAIPGTYKIPAQKQEDKSIAEGTVQYDDATKQITVCLGCGYSNTATSFVDAATTTEATETAKGSKTPKSVKANKAKTVISFSGTKVDQGTVSTNQ